MNWKCPNCGKSVEYSVEQLTETRGVVVCPQCLSTEQVPGYDKPRAKSRTNPSPTTTQPSRLSQPSPSQPTTQPQVSTPPPRKTRTTPPPHRSKTIKFSEPDAGTSSAPHATKRKSSAGKGKKSSSGRSTPVTAWGCVWRSVMITLVLLVLYMVFGFLLQGL